MNYWDNFYQDCGISADHQKVFRKLLDFYLNKRECYNFTAIRDEEGFVTKHFYDSVKGFQVFENSEYGEDFLKRQNGVAFLDIGSGGGFPAVPLAALYPKHEFELLDAVQKNEAMVKELAAKFEMDNLEGVHGRAEEKAHDAGFREDFEIVTCRAFADWSMLLELCLPFVKVGGVLLAYQGPNKVQELSDKGEVVEILGGEVRDVLSYELPDGNGERAIVVIEKVKSTDKKYPRNMGAVKKRPL